MKATLANVALPAERICRKPEHSRSWRLADGGSPVCFDCAPPAIGVEFVDVAHMSSEEAEVIAAIGEAFDADLVEEPTMPSLASVPSPATAEADFSVTELGPTNGSRPESADGLQPPLSIRLVTAREFADADHPGGEPLVGEPGDMLLPEGGDLILYGDGGASKTTIALDLACHMAAGEPWLGAFAVPRQLRVALVEAEGPEAPFAAKLGRKLDSWQGAPIEDRLVVLAEPWANFDFRRDHDVAAQLGRLEIDVLIVGPVATVGMIGNGTIAEAREFMAAVAGFRAASGRPLGMVLIHHSNAAHRVSGAFEGACDTLVQAEVSSPGKTSLWFEKCRWSSSWHKQRRRLAWTDGEAFELTGTEDRDLLGRIEAFLRESPNSPTGAVATGINARPADVRELLNEHLGSRFHMATGSEAKALGARGANSKLWTVMADV